MTVNRWRIPVGAVLVHVCIGSVYAWSTFNRPIQALLSGQPWWFSPPYTTFTTALALLGLSAAFGGPWVERRRVPDPGSGARDQADRVGQPPAHRARADASASDHASPSGNA